MTQSLTPRGCCEGKKLLHKQKQTNKRLRHHNDGKGRKEVIKCRGVGKLEDNNVNTQTHTRKGAKRAILRTHSETSHPPHTRSSPSMGGGGGKLAHSFLPEVRYRWRLRTVPVGPVRDSHRGMQCALIAHDFAAAAAGYVPAESEERTRRRRRRRLSRSKPRAVTRDDDGRAAIKTESERLGGKLL